MHQINRLLGREPISSDPLLLIGGMSRSGTTLLTAVFDAHPDISMGTELIPGPIDAPAVLLQKLDAGLALAEGDFSRAGRALAKNGDYPVGIFIARCCRAGLTLEEVRTVLEAHAEPLRGGVKSWRDRLLLAWAMIRTRWVREKTALFGFKLNSAAISQTARLFPNARFVCIIRDPFDMADSQLSKGFGRDPQKIARNWTTVVSSYNRFAELEPKRCVVLRYEDLVRAPYRTLQSAFSVLPISFDPAIVSFNTSGAQVLKAAEGSRHPNLDQLRKGFFLGAIGRGRQALNADVRNTIETRTAPLAAEQGYGTPGLVRRRQGLSGSDIDKPFEIERGEITRRRALHEAKRCFDIGAYQEILAPYLSTHEVLRLCDIVRAGAVADRKILVIRHDIDHDIENAVKIAEWEKERGIRSTFCILHTAWYYGRLEGDRYRHSQLLVESVERMLELGHEINFHNNLLTLALTEGVDPKAVLLHELAAWDRRGVPIVGTSMHGDKLCHKLNYRNSELFRECVEERFGGLRRVVHEADRTGTERSVETGQISMFDYGLEYEAYDLARDIYHTDSGGNLRTRTDTRGRRSFGRKKGRGEVVGVLTHPVWWRL